MPFPWRESRCWCRRLAIGSFSGEPYCGFHIPFRQMSEEYTQALYDLVGKTARDKMIDDRFPNDFTDWGEYYGWVKDTVERLSIETGLLMLPNP